MSNEKLHKIVRGETSACEAYKQALDKIDDHPERAQLKQMKSDHEEALQYWKTETRLEGEVPEQDSGAWGTVVKGFVGTAKVFGDSATLKAMKEGEEHGLKSYHELLESDEISAVQKQKITSTFIPNQERNIRKIDSLM